VKGFIKRKVKVKVTKLREEQILRASQNRKLGRIYGLRTGTDS
jgi:hypothetical protein